MSQDRGRLQNDKLGNTESFTSQIETSSFVHLEGDDSSNLDPSKSWSSFPEYVETFKASQKFCRNYSQTMNQRSFRSALLRREYDKQTHERESDIQKEPPSKSPNEKLLENKDHLDALLIFSEELFSNLCVVLDRQIYDSRRISTKKHLNLLEEIESDMLKSNRKYDQIVKQYSQLQGLEEAFELFEKLQKQRDEFNSIMSSKEAIIENCENECLRLVHQCDTDLVRHGKLLACLMQRADHQVEVVKKAYNRHLAMFADTFLAEHQLYIVNANRKWKRFFETLNISIFKRADVVNHFEEFFRKELNRIENNQEQLTRQTLKRLEKDADAVRMELVEAQQELKINASKQFNNYEVLKKLDEEHKILMNKEKCKLWRLYDRVLTLRKQLSLHRKKESIDKKIIGKEIRSLHTIISFYEMHWFDMHMVKKTHFDKIWDINYEELMETGNRVLDLEQLICEYPLFIPYNGTLFTRENINLVYKNDSIFQVNQQDYEPKSKEKWELMNASVSSTQMRLIRNILRNLSDRCEFLIDDHLFNIMKPMESKDKFLIRLDTIFASLQVETIDDILELVEVFKKYAHCPNCQHDENRKTSIEILYETALKYKDELPILSVLPNGLEKALQLCKANFGKSSIQLVKKKRMGKCTNHYLVLEPTLVRLALAIYCIDKRTPIIDPTIELASFIQMKEQEMCEYWETFNEITPKWKLKKWQLTTHFLLHFKVILKRRLELIAEINSLERQIRELEYLKQKLQVDCD